MKRLLTTIAVGALVAAAAQAQAVLGYTLSQTQGTYSPLTDATLVYDAAGAANSDLGETVFTPSEAATASGTAQGYEIGFEMDLAGVKYSNFLISGSGYLYFGNGEIEFNPMMQANAMTYSGDYTCFGLAVNKGVTGYDNTRISYKVVGDGDAARLVVQYENFGVNYAFWNGDTPVDMQLSIDKKGNASVCFSGMASLTAEGNNYQLYLFIRQGENFVDAAGESGSLTLLHNDRGTALFPPSTPDGTTVSFAAPGDCVRPTAQPTELVLEATSNQIEGSFTAASGADVYLVTYTIGDAAGAAPVDGTAYSEGDKLGDATVVYMGPGTDFTMYSLEGGKDFHFTIYAVSAYGYGGPLYDIESPLTGSVATNPAPAESIDLETATLNSLTFKVTGNAADDEVVVLYNSYCDRDNYGDHGLFGDISAEAKAGDVIPAPEDYTPLWNYEGVPMPANAGTVAYVGKAGESFTIEGLASGTTYYLGIYTRNAAGVFTTEPLYVDYSTNIEAPYNGDNFNFPRYSLPGSWSTSSGEGATFAFRDDAYWNRTDLVPRQGTQIMQFSTQINKCDPTNGKEGWITMPPVVVNDRHLIAKFDYCLTFGQNRFSNVAYNDWAENDRLEIRVSEDNGQTWTPVATYTADEHPNQEETLSYVSISADLNDYRGKTVLLQLYWNTYGNAPFGLCAYIDRISILQGEFPAVPEVSVGKITHDSAVVSWISQQEDYELVYNEVGGNITYTVNVEGAKSYTLEGLQPNTEYTVKVRGLLEGDEVAYSEWSDPVIFTTADYPAVDAPENLVSDVETFATLGYVQLSWGKVDEALSYEVAYRIASSTEWVNKTAENNTLLLTELEGGETYIWKVRAFCTHDRETAYSGQARFTAPEMSGVADAVAESAVVTAGVGYVAVEGAEGAPVAVYNAAGVQVAVTASAAVSERYTLAEGIYIVTVGNRACKVVVK